MDIYSTFFLFFMTPFKVLQIQLSLMEDLMRPMNKDEIQKFYYVVNYYIDEGSPVMKGIPHAKYIQALSEATLTMECKSTISHADILRCDISGFCEGLLQCRKTPLGGVEHIDLEKINHHSLLWKKATAWKQLPMAIVYAVPTAKGVVVYSYPLFQGSDNVPNVIGLYNECTCHEAVESAAVDLSRGVRLVSSR